MIKSYSDLEVFKLSYSFAMEVFKATKTFPADEKYSLTGQIIRSSRSISANIAEEFAKRFMNQDSKNILFMRKVLYEESKVCITFAFYCNYIKKEQFDDFRLKTDEIGAKLYKLYTNWKS